MSLALPSLPFFPVLPAHRRRRAAALTALALAVLGAHVALVLPATWQPGPPAGRGGPTWQVRAIVAAAPPPLSQPSPVSESPPLQRSESPEPARSARATAAAAAPSPAPTAAAIAPTEPSEVATANPPEASALPVYATRPADPVTLTFETQRGERRTRTQLAWDTDGTRYALTLAGDDPALARSAMAGAASHGRVDEAGLAPDRFVDRRGGRDRHATNFDRDAARIRFSASTGEQPLLAGAQDRLSWLLQLSAAVRADAALSADGAHIALWVAGTRGEAAVWSFEVLGRETLALPAGEVADALHLQRRAPQPYALQVDVWLDPARQHLPVRLRQALPPGSWVSDWRLLSLDWAADKP